MLTRLQIKREVLYLGGQLSMAIHNSSKATLRGEIMDHIKHVLAVAVVTLGLHPVSTFAESKSPISKMSKDDLIKLAMSAAPAKISKDATVLIPGEDGKLVEVKKGSNGFTCIPDIDGQEKPDPICADPAAWQWGSDMLSGAPKPTNTAPGIAYMARGGWHWEKDGKILMKEEPGSKRVKEPPHWMILWRWRSGSRAFRVCRTSSVPT